MSELQLRCMALGFDAALAGIRLDDLPAEERAALGDLFRGGTELWLGLFHEHEEVLLAAFRRLGLVRHFASGTDHLFFIEWLDARQR